MTTYIGDNTGAFNNTLFTISLVSEIDSDDIKRAEVYIGSLVKVYENPVFPLCVNLNENETSKLFGSVLVRLKVFDSLSRGTMCEGFLTINIEDWKIGKYTNDN